MFSFVLIVPLLTCKILYCIQFVRFQHGFQASNFSVNFDVCLSQMAVLICRLWKDTTKAWSDTVRWRQNKKGKHWTDPKQKRTIAATTFWLEQEKKRLSGGVCDVYKPFPWSQFGSLKAACRALLSEITKSYFDILNFLITNCLHTETNENCISHWKTENVLESIK